MLWQWSACSCRARTVVLRAELLVLSAGFTARNVFVVCRTPDAPVPAWGDDGKAEDSSDSESSFSDWRDWFQPLETFGVLMCLELWQTMVLCGSHGWYALSDGVFKNWDPPCSDLESLNRQHVSTWALPPWKWIVRSLQFLCCIMSDSFLVLLKLLCRALRIPQL